MSLTCTPRFASPCACHAPSHPALYCSLDNVMLGNGFIGDGGGSSLTRTGAGGVKRGKVEQQRLSSPTPSVAKDLGCTASSRFPGGLTSYENDMRRLLTAVRRCTLHSPFAVT